MKKGPVKDWNYFSENANKGGEPSPGNNGIGVPGGERHPAAF